MAKRKKKAWNMSNPLYRYLHGGKAKKKASRKRKATKGGIKMAKKRYSRKSSTGGLLTRGIMKPQGIIASMLIGAGAATLAEKVVPQVIPYQGEAIGFAVGGVGGAAGAFARNALKGMSTTSSGAYF